MPTKLPFKPLLYRKLEGLSMRRREFLGLIGGAAAWPVTASAQQPATPVIGYLSGLSQGDRPALLAAFHRGLAVAGYTAGRNVAIEYRFADSQPERLNSLAADLIARGVAVIAATGGNNSGLAARSLTATIPIVFTSGLDPVKAGLVNSLNRPEANVTGISFFTVELGQKHIELMRELVPAARLIGVMLNRNNPESVLYEKSVNEGAQAMGLQLLVLNGGTAAETDDAFAEFSRQRADGVIISADPNLTARTKQITALAARLAVPAVYSNREHPAAGGLLSYGNNLPEVYRRAGLYTGRILKGDKPSDLPVERATQFELILNMKTAQALGIDIPLSLQMRIDEVIE
jgi:putative tryptophan/tyrosine transport system substrate-binding protein